MSSSVAKDRETFEAFADELRRRACETGQPVVVLRGVDSTNVLARAVTRRLVAEGGPQRRVLFAAWQQSAGRGRLGRSWTSAPGLGVYATLVLAPAPSEPPLALLPLVTGIGLCHALRRHLPAVGLKWPNDLVVGGRKLGGILIEMLPMPEGRQAAVIGFGVNHGHAASELPTDTATSLRVEGAGDRSGSDSPLAALLLELVQGLGAAFERYTEPERILDEYREVTVHRAGDPLRCKVQERSIDGTFLDFDEQGRLRLRCGHETVVVAAGDVIEGEAVAREPAGDAPARSGDGRLGGVVGGESTTKIVSGPGRSADRKGASGGGDFPSSADQLFFQAIEAHFVRLRGAPLLLSPADWEVARSWRQRGIPLAVVHGALEEVFARRRERGTASRVNSLRYCAQAVEKAWRELTELGRPAEAGSGPGQGAEPPSSVGESLDLLAGRLPETLPAVDAWRQRVRGLEGGAERVEEGLAALDGELLSALDAALPVEERAELRHAARAAAAKLAERLGSSQVESAVERLVAVRVRERWQVPVLSLFSPEARRRPTPPSAPEASMDGEPSAGPIPPGEGDDDPA